MSKNMRVSNSAHEIISLIAQKNNRPKTRELDEILALVTHPENGAEVIDGLAVVTREHMGKSGKYAVDRIKYNQLIQKWNDLVNAKMDGQDISEDEINAAFAEIQAEEKRLTNGVQ